MEVIKQLIELFAPASATRLLAVASIGCSTAVPKSIPSPCGLAARPANQAALGSAKTTETVRRVRNRLGSGPPESLPRSRPGRNGLGEPNSRNQAGLGAITETNTLHHYIPAVGEGKLYI